MVLIYKVDSPSKVTERAICDLTFFSLAKVKLCFMMLYFIINYVLFYTIIQLLLRDK